MRIYDQQPDGSVNWIENPIPMDINEVWEEFSRRQDKYFDQNAMALFNSFKTDLAVVGQFSGLKKSVIDYVQMYNMAIWADYRAIKDHLNSGGSYVDDDLPAELPPPKINFFGILSILQDNPEDGISLDQNYYATI